MEEGIVNGVHDTQLCFQYYSFSYHSDNSFYTLLSKLNSLSCQLEMLRGLPDLLSIEHKPDGSVVTNVDRYSSINIINFLKEYAPNEHYVSEEDTCGLKDRDEISSLPTWVIDPLDHTRRFITGDKYYIVSLTRLVDYQATEIILLQPAFEALFYVKHKSNSSKRGGSFVNGVPISVSKNSDVNQSKIASVFCEFPGMLANHLGLDETPEALIAVANGVIDGAVIRLCGHKIWDIAFASLLVEEAGGKVTDEYGLPILYRNITPTEQYIVASNGLIHDDLLERIANQRK